MGRPMTGARIQKKIGIWNRIGGGLLSMALRLIFFFFEIIGRFSSYAG